jgi:hypothetical protein
MKKIRPHMLKHDDTSTDTATRAVRCGLLLGGLRISYAQVRWTQWILRGLDPLSVTPYIHERYLYCCVYCVIHG